MFLRIAAVGSLVLLPFLLTGCAGRKQARVSAPSPPAITPPEFPRRTRSLQLPSGRRKKPRRLGEESSEAISVPPDAKPISVETGLASWYGAPYHNRRGSNGQVYDMNAMTAAHRTLPLGSIVRVTNLKTGHSGLVRITDRGPFIPGRVLDLSLAAAKKVDVWQPGVATVRIEVMETPAPLTQGDVGRCRSAPSTTRMPRTNWPTTSPTATTRRRFCASAARWATGGSECASWMTTGTRRRTCPRHANPGGRNFPGSGWTDKRPTSNPRTAPV